MARLLALSIRSFLFQRFGQRYLIAKSKISIKGYM